MFNKISWQFIRFCIVGVFCTIVNYGVFFVLFSIFGINYIISSSIGFIMGVFVGFPFNKNWTFDNKELSFKSIMPYFMVYVFSLIISIMLLKFLVSVLNINPLISNVICICVTTVTNFIGVKLLIFKR